MRNIRKSSFEFFNKPATALIPYIPHLEKWLQSHLCFLRQEEKETLKSWLHIRNPGRMAAKLGISEAQINERLKSIVFVLGHKLKDFYKWHEHEVLGTYTIMDKREKFLNADFAYHPISLKLYYNLCNTSCNNLLELLEEYTLEDMKMFRGFGKISLDELMALLKANNCYGLLKRKIKVA